LLQEKVTKYPTKGLNRLQVPH